MGVFHYRAIGRGGAVLTGVVEAASREAAIAAVRRKDVVPLHVVATAPGWRMPWFSRPAGRRVGDRDLMLFTRELGTLLSAGLPMDRALGVLDQVPVARAMADVPGALLAAIRSGSALSSALEAHPETFPPYYVGMIKAGEAGGALVEVLGRLAHMLERREALTATVRSALTYPLIVLALTGMSLVILLVYVVPEFRPMFDDAGIDVPVLTRGVLAVSAAVTEWGWLALLSLLAAVLALRTLRLPGVLLVWWDRLVLGLPLAGPILTRVETARFCRSLGTLRANGVPLVEAVQVAAATLTNREMARSVRDAVGPLSRGEGLAAPMRRSGRFPPLALQLVDVGEESGRLHEMLLQVADVYEAETAREVEKALTLLAPAVTVLLGCLIALIIGSILSAILGTYEMAR